MFPTSFGAGAGGSVGPEVGEDSLVGEAVAVKATIVENTVGVWLAVAVGAAGLQAMSAKVKATKAY